MTTRKGDCSPVMKLIFSDGSACGRIRHGEAASADGIGSDGISEVSR